MIITVIMKLLLLKIVFHLEYYHKNKISLLYVITCFNPADHRVKVKKQNSIKRIYIYI